MWGLRSRRVTGENFQNERGGVVMKITMVAQITKLGILLVLAALLAVSAAAGGGVLPEPPGGLVSGGVGR
jgi:hypothetical protein